MLSNSCVKVLNPYVLESKLGSIFRSEEPTFEIYASSSSLVEISNALSIMAIFSFGKPAFCGCLSSISIFSSSLGVACLNLAFRLYSRLNQTSHQHFF